MNLKFHKISHEILRPFRDSVAFLFRLGATLSLFRNKDAIIVDSDILQCCGKVIPKNWGDDLNAYFLQKIFHKKFVFNPIKFLLFGNAKRENHYQFIGSVVGKTSGAKRIVWGGTETLRKFFRRKSEIFSGSRTVDT